MFKNSFLKNSVFKTHITFWKSNAIEITMPEIHSLKTSTVQQQTIIFQTQHLRKVIQLMYFTNRNCFQRKLFENPAFKSYI